MPLNDPYVYDRDVSGPISSWFAITPDNDVDLPIRPRAVYATTSGNIAMLDADGTEAVFAFSAGEIRPLRPTRIKAALTTCTGIIGLY